MGSAGWLRGAAEWTRSNISFNNTCWQSFNHGQGDLKWHSSPHILNGSWLYLSSPHLCPLLVNLPTDSWRAHPCPDPLLKIGQFTSWLKKEMYFITSNLKAIPASLASTTRDCINLTYKRRWGQPKRGNNETLAGNESFPCIIKGIAFTFSQHQWTEQNLEDQLIPATHIKVLEIETGDWAINTESVGDPQLLLSMTDIKNHSLRAFSL